MADGGISVEKNTTLVLKMVDKIIATSSLALAKTSSKWPSEAQCDSKVLQIKIRIYKANHNKQQKV